MQGPYKQAQGVERNGMHPLQTGYEDLANAIICFAAQDYKMIYRQVNILGNGKASRRELFELEEFFRSEYYRRLTSVDGEELMERLREEVVKEALNDSKRIP